MSTVALPPVPAYPAAHLLISAPGALRPAGQPAAAGPTGDQRRGPATGAQADGCRAPECHAGACSGRAQQDQTSLPASPMRIALWNDGALQVQTPRGDDLVVFSRDEVRQLVEYLSDPAIALPALRGHNFEPMHKEAKRIVDALGVHSLEEAEAWMEREFAEPAFPHVAQGGGGVSDYEHFVRRKLSSVMPTGIASGFSVPSTLFPHQSALTAWALRRGRAAIFADTGLGKSRMQLAWADAVRLHTKRPVLILAPLAVAAQTEQEGRAIGIEAIHCRDGAEAPGCGIVITNYDRLHRFDPEAFGAVVLDESSCIKHHDAKTLQTLLDAFKDTPFKLCTTATPAPNDWTELGTHAQFLGICTRQEMLAEFFTHDGGDTSVWRLKGHARQLFWRWVCQWGALVRKPSDLGFDDSAYALPPLHLHEHTVKTQMPLNGMLFALEAQTLSERREARRLSIDDRVAECAAIVNADNQPWVVWCDLNAEGDDLAKAIDGAVQIAGADSVEVKEQRLQDFADGKFRVLVTKASICGFGLNWQHAARMAFVGVTDSFESYYQAVRRCWRFGQKRDVHVHVFASSAEGAVVANLKRKERDAKEMAESLSAETHDAVMAEVVGSTRHTNAHDAAQRVAIPDFLMRAA